MVFGGLTLAATATDLALFYFFEQPLSSAVQDVYKYWDWSNKMLPEDLRTPIDVLALTEHYFAISPSDTSDDVCMRGCFAQFSEESVRPCLFRVCEN